MEPRRIVLSKRDSLEGCGFVLGNELWFCSVRAENYREIDFYIAEYVDGEWTNWKNAGRQLNEEYDVGELHITSDYKTMYFGSNRTGGFGGRDLWKSERVDGGWNQPVNLGPTVNSERDEDMPFVTQAGEELWFTGRSTLGFTGPAVFRCIRCNDGWGEPEEVFSNFAGEPTLDAQGNVYFVHHFYSEYGEMIEADIYVAYRR